MNAISLKGKRLLVLGGLAQNIVAIERAQELGCHVTVVDFLHNSPGKKISNESYMISITNVQEIVKLCKRLRIDGVMNYCIDPGQIPYQQICSQLDYPCYGKSNEFKILTNKEVFYTTCVKFGVGTVQRYKVNHTNYTLDTKNNKYPIVIKPADGRSSKGISICNSEADLEKCIKKI